MGRIIAWLLALVLVVAPLAAVGEVLASARSYDNTPTEAIAVLGASQYWGEPSPIFTNRLDHAKELWDLGVAPVIITVGGKQPGDLTTEAQAGREYLLSQGVPADRVIAVPSGTDTLESVQDIDVVMAEQGWTSLTLVSDRTHLARSKAIASALGLEARVSGRAFQDGSRLAPDKVLREAGGLLRFHLFDRWFLLRPAAG